MTTWQKIADIVSSYEDNKNIFRKAFGTRSDYIEALEKQVHQKKLADELLVEDYAGLILQVLKHWPNFWQASLAYECALKVTSICMGDQSEEYASSKTLIERLTGLKPLIKKFDTFLIILLTKSTPDTQLLAVKELLPILKNSTQPDRCIGLFFKWGAQGISLPCLMSLFYQEMSLTDKKQKKTCNAKPWYVLASKNIIQNDYKAQIQFYKDKPKANYRLALPYFKVGVFYIDKSTIDKLDVLAASRRKLALLLAKWFEQGDQKSDPVVNVDRAKACYYYELASKQTSKSSDIWLANYFGAETKEEPPVDRDKALFYHKRAAKKDHLPSVCYLFHFYFPKRHSKAMKFAIQAVKLKEEKPLERIKQEANQGDVNYQYALGCFYNEQGKLDIALPWLIKAHKAKHVQAVRYLEAFNFDGKTLFGIAESLSAPPNANAEEANKFYRKSVEKKHLPAVKHQALQTQSFQDFLLAAELGDPTAEDTLERLALEEGNAQQANQLAKYYENRNPNQHKFWKEQANLESLNSEEEGGDNVSDSFLQNLKNEFKK